jgi:hypothetical protein
VSVPRVIPRAEWRARAPKSAPVPLLWSQIDTLVIHYSGALSDELPSYPSRVRGIQNYHMDVVDPPRHWNDIAYNFLVAKTGEVFEGRGWGVMSAATLNHNGHTLAFCFLGGDKDDRNDVTDDGRKALAFLIRDAQRRAGKPHRVAGHRDFVSTECPGDELYAFVTSQGWRGYEFGDSPYPKNFFLFASWWLGEGVFREAGPRNPAVRPSQIPARVPDAMWRALEHFVEARTRSRAIRKGEHPPGEGS